MDINDLLEKTKFFALRIIVLCKYLVENKNETVLSQQLLHSGTAVGAHVREAVRAQPKADLNVKLNAAFTDADECAYWLELLYGTNYLDKEQFVSIYEECKEIISMILSLTKTPKQIKTVQEFFRIQ